MPDIEAPFIYENNCMLINTKIGSLFASDHQGWLAKEVSSNIHGKEKQ